ncbi:MAG: tRNA pseudouridine(38-40) synthase TruA [Streptococcaceae bacterium]|jgi:tRNA pseudouridine38-40 synthase|nr:tRNA pseudouridine(38-40) synthase TruA [Streptococcaceae bacterium]
MPRYKAIIAYDGTLFAGFQRQPKVRTIQKELEKVLTKINNGQKIKIHGAGRTDKGVHALNQVIHFDFPRQYCKEKMRFALDTKTPNDIAIKSIKIVPNNWHARFVLHEKTYEFHVQILKPRNPFKRKYTTYFPYPIELARIKTAIKFLEGFHDFTGFTASNSKTQKKSRTIYEASVKQINDELIFTFRGNGFLYKQIRIMVGTLLKIGNSRMELTQILKILNEKKRSLAGPTAHPEGLFLKKVRYFS